MGDLLQMGMLLGSTVAGLRAVTRLVVVVWSLRADTHGRRHALLLLDSLEPRREIGSPLVGLSWLPSHSRTKVACWHSSQRVRQRTSSSAR